MDWKEYQNIVAEIYSRAEGIGKISKNILLPDKVTGQQRQVDALLEIKTKGHKVCVLIDTKYHRRRIDTPHVDVVSELAKAVGADKAVIVCLNGWTRPAKIKADHIGLDLRLITAQDAAEFFNPGTWKLCPICENDYIIMDNVGGIDGLETEDVTSWWAS